MKIDKTKANLTQEVNKIEQKVILPLKQMVTSLKKTAAQTTQRNNGKNALLVITTTIAAKII